jgi:hypothetical protein
MVAKNVALLACAVGSLMACTTRPDPELAGPTPDHIPPPEVSIELPLEQRLPREPLKAQACLLSTTKSCIELDSRPFEACLVGAKSCSEKGEGGVTPLDAPEAPVPDYSRPQTR